MQLVAQAGCSESQVREYFTKLRSNVRSFMQRLQRRATSAEAPAAGADLQTAQPLTPAQLQPSGGALSAALSNTAPSQLVSVQSTAAAAGSVATTGPQLAQGPAPSGQMHAAPGVYPTSAPPPQASPMTAANLRNLLANVASAQVALQQYPAGASAAAPVKVCPAPHSTALNLAWPGTSHELLSISALDWSSSWQVLNGCRSLSQLACVKIGRV